MLDVLVAIFRSMSYFVLNVWQKTNKNDVFDANNNGIFESNNNGKSDGGGDGRSGGDGNVLQSISPGMMLTLVSTFLYLVIYFGPKFMKDRKPYNLKWTIFFYNFAMMILNASICVRGLLSGNHWENHISCKNNGEASNNYETSEKYSTGNLNNLNNLDVEIIRWFLLCRI